MMDVKFVVFVVCIFVTNVLISAQEQQHLTIFHHEFKFRQYFQKMRFPPEAAADSGCSEESYFTQIVDHFNNTNQKTWDQRFQVNNKYFKESVTDQPAIFLSIGGEETINDQNICYEKTPLLKMAKTHNALIIQLEHRFFGKSYPLKYGGTFGDLSVESLKLLSPQQALEDLANFIKTFKYKNIEWSNPRWILFGGSYPGSLCAWSRAFYPDISVGGICSSAPLWAKLNFYEYAEVMEYAILNYSSIKYPTCSASIKSGFNQLTQLISSSDGRNTLNNIFNITPNLNLTSRNDIESDAFLSIMFNVFQGIVQYNIDNSNYVTGYNIDKLCKKFSTRNDPVKAIRDVFFETKSASDGIQKLQMVYINYERDIKILSQTVYNFSDPISQQIALIRAWRWLLCGSGLGWMQSAEKKDGMFGISRTLNFSLMACTDIFTSMNADSINKNVLQISEHFHLPWNYTATNVVLTNGDYDPWSALRSNVTDESRHQISKVVHGASHCADLLQTIPGDSEELMNLRALTEKEVAYYLNATLPSSNQANLSYPTLFFVFFTALIYFV